MEYRKTGSDTCTLVFKSNVEGIATTYANLYRRSLLQSTPKFSVAGIRCNSNGNYAKNFFEIIPGMTTSLIDVYMSLFNAVYDIDCEGDSIILSVVLSDGFNLSDLCDKEKTSPKFGTDYNSIQLVSQDKKVTAVVGNNNITIDVYLKRSVGFLSKDINVESLKRIVGDSNISTWIVCDSQHRGVASVSYNSDTKLGRQTVTLDVKSHQNNIEEIIRGCTEHIKKIITKFEEVTI